MSCSFRWFINAKLRTKLLLLVIPTMLLLLCVTLTLSFLVFNQYEAMVYGSTEQILNMAAGEIEDNLMRIESIESSLIGSDEIQSALSLTEPNARRREPTTDYNRLALGVYGKMEKCLAENPFVSSISIYVEDQSFFSGSKIMLESQEDEEDLAWILTEAAEGKGKTVWLPRGDKLLCVKEIRDIRTMTLSPLGVVVMRVDLKKFGGGEPVCRSGQRLFAAHLYFVRNLHHLSEHQRACARVLSPSRERVSNSVHRGRKIVRYLHGRFHSRLAVYFVCSV